MDSIIEDIQEGYIEAITYLEFLNGKMTELSYYGGSTTDVSKLDEIKKLETKINIYSKFAAYLGQLLSKYKTGDKKMEKFELVTEPKEAFKLLNNNNLYYGIPNKNIHIYEVKHNDILLYDEIISVFDDLESKMFFKKVIIEPLTREQLIDCLLEDVEVMCCNKGKQNPTPSNIPKKHSIEHVCSNHKMYDYYKASDIEGIIND